MKLYLLGVALLGILAAVGCGGSGSSTPPGAAGVTVFLTDDLNTGYDHVWVTVYKVELKRQDGTFQVAYSDATGQSVDLRALSSGGVPIYSFLAFQNLPAGTYTAVRVTMSKNLMLFPTGATVGTPQTFVAAYDAGPGLSAITFDLTRPKMVAGVSDVVVDFDLSQWTVGPTGVTAVAKEGDDSRLADGTRQHADDHRGTVSALTGTDPNFTFTLTLSHGGTVQVRTDSTTGIYDSDGANPTLANGETVTVRGTFSVADNALLATSIRIKGDAGDDGRIAAFGAPSNENAAAGTFDLTVVDAEGFVPANTVVHVVLASDAKLFGEHCTTFATPADFFTALAGTTGANVTVAGSFDSASDTLTAHIAKIVVDHEDTNQVEVQGTVATTPAPDATAGTLTVTVSEWEGMSFSSGTALPVVTNGSTVFKMGSTTATQAAFFAALTPGTTGIQVIGTFDGTTVTAQRLKIEVAEH